ncbi:MAG: hypothetical protein AB7L76_09730 [Burkholderiaceae bacterium]
MSVAAWLLLAVAIARVLTMMLASPAAAYANQYDMVRTSACIGWWPQTPPGVDPAAAYQPAPRLAYVPGPRLSHVCYPSTTVALAFAALAVDRGLDQLGLGSPQQFDLRMLGALQAALFIALLLFFDRRWRDHPGARLTHALIAALVLADPFNTLYLSTLYTEFAALLSAYVAVAVLVDAALRGGLSWPMALLFALALAGVGLSRMQHLLLPAALALLMAGVCALQSLGIRRALPGLLVAAAMPFAQSLGTADQRSIHTANRSNALFGALLPASAEPMRMVARLGLPPACTELVHTTWFLRRGRDAQRECPEAYAIGSAALLAAFAGEPRTVAVAAGRMLSQSMGWRLPYLGEVVDGQHARLGAGPLQLRASVADLLARAGFEFHAALWLGTLLLGATAVVAGVHRAVGMRRSRATHRDATSLHAAVSPRVAVSPHVALSPHVAVSPQAAAPPHAPDPPLAAATLFAATALIAGSALATTLFGDGYSEVARHLHLGANAALGALAALVIGVALSLVAATSSVASATTSATVPTAATIAIAGIAASAVAIAAVAAVLWPRLPLAVGVLAQPASDRWTADGWTVSGWALDPAGVSAAYVEAGDGHRVPLNVSDDARVTAIFPQRAGISAVRLRGTIAAAELAARPAPWRIVVVNSRSVASVLDWRWPRSEQSASLSP